MQSEELRRVLLGVHRQVMRHFIFRSDRAERWDMPPRGYDGSAVLRDDCDGFCLACRTLLRRAGLRSRLVYCEIARRGHLVVEVDGWILDNLQKTVVPNTVLRDYRWLRISGYEPGDPWREII
ncbi:hypothetical protein FKG94_02510 [Exilibacterium tricleocarpae]|uniref:Transglutaminase-like domain-containing protein n=1 Tax=Exilibacterium tricleocarpae TaxID=2591008 RepID=A0A545U8D1_9GAMM|nr:transglutaminase-like cysteine peptidase [Exilibacterium tricleocarpae]TQV85734.1 hypothetical protein FKG94_02510 [Exilibacterium tricleocarpae]